MTGPMPTRFDFWPLPRTVRSPGEFAAQIVLRWQEGRARPRKLGASEPRNPWRVMQELAARADAYRAELGGPVWPLPKVRPRSQLSAEDEATLADTPDIATELELGERVERMIAAQECDDLADAIAHELRRAGVLFASDILVDQAAA